MAEIEVFDRHLLSQSRSRLWSWSRLWSQSRSLIDIYCHGHGHARHGHGRSLHGHGHVRHGRDHAREYGQHVEITCLNVIVTVENMDFPL